jgi:serine/threonine protein kinase
VFILCVILFLFYEYRRQLNDSVWLVKKEELKFDDPPQILGRGTFGLVLLGEYRGTQVAVKRVIPPREDLEKPKKSSSAESNGSKPMSISKMFNPKLNGAENSVSSNSRLDTERFAGGGEESHHSASADCESTYETGQSSWGFSSIGGTILNQGEPSKVGKSSRHKRAPMKMNYKKLKENFLEEMRYLSKLRHPCITTVMGKSLMLMVCNSSLGFV